MAAALERPDTRATMEGKHELYMSEVEKEAT